NIPPGIATLGVRPEHVGIRRDGPGDTRLPVRLIEPLGKDTLLYLNDGTERAFVAVTEGLAMAELKPGTTLYVTLEPDKICLFGNDGRRIADDSHGATISAARRARRVWSRAVESYGRN